MHDKGAIRSIGEILNRVIAIKSDTSEWSDTMGKKVMLKPSCTYFYPWPMTLVTCMTADKKPNIITIGAASVCSSVPPTIGIAVAPQRYSHGLIAASGEFGINLPSPEQVEVTDFCGTRSGRDTDKFAAAGLTMQASAIISAPLIAECPVSLECKLIDTVKLGSHDWMIGEVVAAHVSEDLLNADGQFQPSADHALFCFGGDYHTVGAQIARWFHSA